MYDIGGSHRILRHTIGRGAHGIGGNYRDIVCHFLIATVGATAAVASAAAVIPVVLALSFLRHNACSKQPVGEIFVSIKGGPWTPSMLVRLRRIIGQRAMPGEPRRAAG